jgi:precorrin-6B C5,15-methyltransferase / cobalt-precorrin-6B C5,C15-methyltransferase
MTTEPIVVVGIGADGPAGLSVEACDHLARCRLLAGGRRHLAFFPDEPGREKLVVDADLDRVVRALDEQPADRKIVVLASGDPLCFGIGRRLLDAFGKSRLMFLPTVGSIALAFARLKEPWDDATLVSLHGRPMETLFDAIGRGATKIAVLTDATNDPAAIGRRLCSANLGDCFDLHVCECLGGPGERVTTWSPRSIADQRFDPLNVVVLLRRPGTRLPALPVIGLPAEAIRHRQIGHGMITKTEVRLIALAQLALAGEDVLWDIGAGSGSVSLEAARLGPQMRVCAVERDAGMFNVLSENVREFRLRNLTISRTEAPDGLAELPDPDAVFVGGSGGRLEAILDAALTRLHPGGRLVVNCVTMQTLTTTWRVFEARNLRPDVTSVQIARSRPLGGLDGLEADRPIFIVRAVKS